MMIFQIFREFEVEGRKKRKVLVEWNEEKIKNTIAEKIKKNAGVSAEIAFLLAWSATIKEFKKETINIP